MPIVPDVMMPVIEVSSSGTTLLQVWLDGRIMWSGDTIRSGSPLQMATIDPADVTSTIKAIRDSVLLGGCWIGEVRTGPDADVTIVRVWDDDTLIVDVGSWHERFEADPDLVVTATGVEPLHGRSRNAVLAQQPTDYRRFRQRWNEVLSRLRRLIPMP